MRNWYQLSDNEKTAISRIVDSLKDDKVLLKMMKEARDNPYTRNLAGFIKNEVTRIFFMDCEGYTLKKHYLDISWLEEGGVIYNLDEFYALIKTGIEGLTASKTGREKKVLREHEIARNG